MKIHYPVELPISSHTGKLIESIRTNDVTIIVGETGSGKSTQIPKMIFEALGAKAMIACTQPRRIAAVSIATRIAEECDVGVGDVVGYKIRFDDVTQPNTKILVCTDGILLQEIKFDVLLSDYDAIFVDEAHERSLRIDFLLGLLKNIRKKRLDVGLKPLKIIIASATLDTEKFSRFFSKDVSVKVAEFSVSGRMFPVDIEYNPVPEEADAALFIAHMVDRIHMSKKAGDILIFLPGEQEINKTISAIQQLGFGDLKCLPLFSRLPMEEQMAIYAEHPGLRHVVVSTNIAETSLTVPGITVVIDSGLARMTDFDVYTGIGSLTVEEIS
ncbi:ATP-dependent RNA helicase, partial [Candidatus Peregrinibacteria bacterium]|nr:ATP-dependent RNA helicase [Candidatus Peregrinibacteria bacterium]